MNGADSSTGEHCDWQFHHHWHVDGNAITFVDAVHFQDVGESTNFFQELAVSESAVVIGMIAFPINRMKNEHENEECDAR